MHGNMSSLIRFGFACLLSAVVLLTTGSTSSAEVETSALHSAVVLDHCDEACVEEASKRYHAVFDMPGWFGFYMGCMDSCTWFHS